MENWIKNHGTRDLKEDEITKYVTKLDTFGKRIVKYRMTTAKNKNNTRHSYWCF
tara:strand:+ start:128 stop:289 length:162 start_codon:yes stop_codon:yes gene_type:complete